MVLFTIYNYSLIFIGVDLHSVMYQSIPTAIIPTDEPPGFDPPQEIGQWLHAKRFRNLFRSAAFRSSANLVPRAFAATPMKALG